MLFKKITQNIRINIAIFSFNLYVQNQEIHINIILNKQKKFNQIIIKL